MPDLSRMKLGLLPAVHNPATVRARDVLGILPPANVRRIDWGRKLDTRRLSRFLNDRLGNCTCAAVGAIGEVWSAWTQPQMQVVQDNAIGDLYRDACGWVPGNHSTDNIGGVISNVMEYWRTHGPIDGWLSLDEHATVNVNNIQEIFDCIWYFGAVNGGWQMPLAWQSADVWDGPPNPLAMLTDPQWKPGGWGGHDFILHMHDGQVAHGLTWGITKVVTPAGILAYMTEGHAPVSKQWLMSSGRTPSDYDYATLLNLLGSLR